ncbi:YppG family protein [Evansella tamaricis]|uniref:YppG family protein n=1 Tax=Evansella tamaricis TaxID=2069301 RepID=A0ABS6JD35_9BACI|nr:YppG family protein [Evansella tamaricis]MBU9710258.1 YppG family protein [Evansella tamaricis]
MYYPPYYSGPSYPPVQYGAYPPQHGQMYWQTQPQPQQTQPAQPQGQQQDQRPVEQENQSQSQQQPQQQPNQQPNQQQHQPFPQHYPGGFGGPGYPHPYARPGSGFLSAFKTKDGKFDFEKASTTLDQVVHLGNQISPIVKQVGGFFKK